MPNLEDASTSARSRIALPRCWALDRTAFSWLDEPNTPRSADAIFTDLSQAAPKVSLHSRVPTFTLPCRQFAAGDWCGHSLEVAVSGDGYSVNINLMRKKEDERSFTLLAEKTVEAVNEMTERSTSMKHLSLSVSMSGLVPSAAQSRFADAIGLTLGDDGVVSQSYSRRAVRPIGYSPGGLLDVEYELATGLGGGPEPHLKLTSQVRTVSGSVDSDDNGWSKLLSVSLDVISTFATS